MLRTGCSGFRAAAHAFAIGLLLAAGSVRAAQLAPPFRGADGKLTNRSTPSSVSTDSSPNEFQRARVQALSRGAAAVNEDTLRVIAFQVQFTDSLMGGQPGSNRTAVRDSTWFANEAAHAEQYFRGASRNRLTLDWTIDGTLYSLPRSMNYYGADSREEERVVELVQTVIELADDTIDFSAYDHVFIIHAGAGQETDLNGDSPNQIWSSFYDRGDIREAQDDDMSLGLATDDTQGGNPFFVDNFSVVPSDASQDFATVGTLGIWTFELASRIGLLAMFDSTPQGAPDSQGIGNFCLMAYGLFNVNGFVPAFPCAFNRVLAGWLDPIVLDAPETPVDVRLTDVNTGADTDTLCVKIPITDSEYFLVTNRVHDANFDSLFTFSDNDSDLVPDNDESLEGAEFDFFLTDLSNPFVRRFSPDYGFTVLYRHTGSGVYVWHVDERIVADAAQQRYLANDYPARKGVDLEEADGVQDMDRPGSSVFALGSHFDSYRTGDGNNPVFGPGTKPASRSNSGAETDVTIRALTPPGVRMRVSIGRDSPYLETRTRWAASAHNQPATAVDIDASGTPEIVALGDDAGLFVFDPSGHEKVDADANPLTIEPFVAVPGVKWIGPPAFANLDGAPDVETVAASLNGDVYIWKGSGAELTAAIPFTGVSNAAAPIVLDAGNGGTPELLVAARGVQTELSFIDTAGGIVVPPNAAGLWPATVLVHYLSPLGVARLSSPDVVGVVACGVDTVAARVVVQWTPLDAAARAAWSQSIAIPSGWIASSFIPSAPAIGDMDHDGDDEIVVTTPDGVVSVFDMSSATIARETGQLAAPYPSAPALGDVDGDGTLEIAVWDAKNMYVLKSNARPMFGWPRPIRAQSAGAAPEIRPRRELESPLIVDIDGGGADIVFPLDDGTLAAFHVDGSVVQSFPRAGPAEPGAAPTFSNLGSTGSAIVLGAYDALRGTDTVVDTLASNPSSSLSVQSLARAVEAPYWSMSRADLARTGRVAEARPLATAAATFEPESFIIYPNPVMGNDVHARVTTNARANVRVSVYTLEGMLAASHAFDVNPNGLIDTPFDESIDVSKLKSGVYVMRLDIRGAGGDGAVYKPFAIRR